MSITLRRATVGIALLFLTSLCPAARAAEGDGWDWIAAPYLWAASVGTDVRTDAVQASSETEFSDIIDKFDGGFQLHLEGQGDQFGVLADLTFLGISDDNDHRFSHTQSDLDTWLIEAAALWTPGDERYLGLDVFAGLRYIAVDLAVQVDPVNPLFETATVGDNTSFSDLMVGARYTWALSERWALMLRGDGSFGDTEGTWNASALGQYRTRNGGWVFGYRHLSVEIKSGGAKAEFTMSGPQIGYAFSF